MQIQSQALIVDNPVGKLEDKLLTYYKQHLTLCVTFLGLIGIERYKLQFRLNFERKLVFH